MAADLYLLVPLAWGVDFRLGTRAFLLAEPPRLGIALLAGRILYFRFPSGTVNNTLGLPQPSQGSLKSRCSFIQAEFLPRQAILQIGIPHFLQLH